MTITGHPSYPPIAWAKQGKIVGAAPTLVRKIAAGLGVKRLVSKDFGSWQAAQGAARDGKADEIFGIYKNDERAAYLKRAAAVRRGGEDEAVAADAEEAVKQAQENAEYPLIDVGADTESGEQTKYVHRRGGRCERHCDREGRIPRE